MERERLPHDCASRNAVNPFDASTEFPALPAHVALNESASALMEDINLRGNLPHESGVPNGGDAHLLALAPRGDSEENGTLSHDRLLSV